MKYRALSPLCSFPLTLGLLLSLALTTSACGADDDGDEEVDCSTSQLTYENFGEQFFSNYCTACHAPGAETRRSPDLDTLDAVQAQSTQVNRRAGNGTNMPPTDPKPSAAERADLDEWITCGTS
ncbi:MAG: cytochrome c [Myxococcales bacterium]|nr:cytochrome c [Myxococcales bacterium]